MKIHQSKDPERTDSFWYDGPIAGIGKYLLIATGDIKVQFKPEDKEGYRGYQAVCEAMKRKYTDKSMKGWDWMNNNWFEVIFGTANPDGTYSIDDCLMGDVYATYDDGIEALKQYAKDRTYEKKKTKVSAVQKDG